MPLALHLVRSSSPPQLDHWLQSTLPKLTGPLAVVLPFALLLGVSAGVQHEDTQVHAPTCDASCSTIAVRPHKCARTVTQSQVVTVLQGRLADGLEADLLAVSQAALQSMSAAALRFAQAEQRDVEAPEVQALLDEKDAALAGPAAAALDTVMRHLFASRGTLAAMADAMSVAPYWDGTVPDADWYLQGRCVVRDCKPAARLVMRWNCKQKPLTAGIKWSSTAVVRVANSTLHACCCLTWEPGSVELFCSTGTGHGVNYKCHLTAVHKDELRHVFTGRITNGDAKFHRTFQGGTRSWASLDEFKARFPDGHVYVCLDLQLV